MRDQAESLRQLLRQAHAPKQPDRIKGGRETKVITVTSGKGGVGKSNFSLNFALHLIQHGKKVVLFDVDLGLANIEVLLGFSPKYSLFDMIKNKMKIEEIMEEGPHGLLFISGGSGVHTLFELDDPSFFLFNEEMLSLQGEVDYIILDTGAGISKENLRFLLAADTVIIVTTPEPTSLTDAYAVLKMIHLNEADVEIKLLINRATTTKEGLLTSDKLKLVARKFLKKEVDVLGYIPDDPQVVQAVKRQSPFTISYPKSDAAHALAGITRSFLDVPVKKPSGIKGFLKKMFDR